MNEIWKDIPGYDGSYQVSNLGRVKNVGRWVKSKGSGKRFVKERIRVLDYGQDRRYRCTTLSFKGKTKRHYVHLLVWEAFNGPIPHDMQVNHINERPWDNRLENLELATRKENCNWGSRNTKISKALSKMVEQYTLEGTHICTWFSLAGIKKELGYDSARLSLCCNEKADYAYGYIWKFRKDQAS